MLEIVERLCSHVAIIHKGQLVAQGSLEELRAGVQAKGAESLGSGGSAESAAPLPDQKLTLEQIFLSKVGGTRAAEHELSWLG